MSWKEAFAAITSKTHTQQTIWWLNGFWEEGADKNAEELWKITHAAIEIETGQKILYGKRKVEVKEGADLDEMKAHVFLEKMGETLTVRDLRKRLKELDVDNNNRMALSEYYLAKWGKTPQDLVNAPQGEGASPAEMADAQSKLDAAQNAMLEVQSALEESTALLAQAKRDEAAAKKALADSVQAEKDAKAAAAAAKTAADAAAKSLVEQEKAESELKKAEDELRVAVDALNAEESAYQKKLSELEAKANDPALGAAKKGAAANELAQMKAEDPMPLRKAKITQGAALKRAEKARAPLAAATEAARQSKVKADQAAEDAANSAADAEEAKKEAERSARAAEESTKAAAKAKADLEVKVQESEAAVAAAEAVLAELKSRKGVPYGAIFWMERQMQEMQKFMPSK